MDGAADLQIRAGLYKRIKQMEKPYAELSDQDLARAIVEITLLFKTTGHR
jgi:hypothetical protein